MNSKIRRATVAGQFYDSNPESLKKHLRKFLSSMAKTQTEERFVQALIVPHAGYAFSGATAGKTFARTAGCSYKRILLIAPSHRLPFEGIALSTFLEYEVPNGIMKVDCDSVRKILSENNEFIDSSDIAHEHEHALEVQLPFLKAIFSDIPLLPIVCGYLDYKSTDSIASILVPFFSEDTLWVISSDFTHFGASFNYVPFKTEVPNNLRSLDMGAIDAIISKDYAAFSAYIEKTGATICGSNPIKLLLKIIEKASGKGAGIKPELVEYTNSGELTQDWLHCVSYAGIAFYRF